MKVYRLTGLLNLNGLMFNVTEFNCSEIEGRIHFKEVNLNINKRRIGKISNILEDPLSKRVYLLDKGQIPAYEKQIYSTFSEFISKEIDNNNKLKNGLLKCKDIYTENQIYETENSLINEEISVGSKKHMYTKEVVQWLMKGCFDTRISDCFKKATDGDIFSLFDNYSAEEIVEKIEQYEKKI